MRNLFFALPKRIGHLFPILALLLIGLLFTACGAEANDRADTEAPESTAVPKMMCDIVKDGTSAYTIVRADAADTEVVRSASSLWRAFQDRYGITIEMISIGPPTTKPTTPLSPTAR